MNYELRTMARLNKIIEYGLYLLVFLLPWQTRLILKPGELGGAPWEYGTFSLYGTDILILFILLVFLTNIIFNSSIFNFQPPIMVEGKLSIFKQFKNFKIKELFRNCKLEIVNLIILGLVGASGVSIVLASDKSLALYSLTKLLLGIGLFWLLARATYDQARLLLNFLSGLAFSASLGIWQFVTQSSFASKWSGLALHDAGELGTSVVEVRKIGQLPERWLRAYGSFDHPNVLGGTTIIGLLLTIFMILKLAGKSNLLAENRSSQEIGFSNFQNKIGAALPSVYHVFLIIFSAALFFSFSRAAWLGGAVALAMTLGLLILKRDKPALVELGKALVLIIAIIAPLSYLYRDVVLTRVEASGRLEAKSIDERLSTTRESLGLIRQHWLAGVGIGNYTLALYNQDDKKQPAWAYQPVHNTFLLILAEAGVFGFLFFFIFMIKCLIFNFQFSIFKQFKNFTIKELFRNWKLEIGNSNGFNNSGSLFIDKPLFVAIIILMLLDHWLWSLHFGIFLLWLVLGLIYRCDKQKIA